jgi:hypothetical protein
VTDNSPWRRTPLTAAPVRGVPHAGRAWLTGEAARSSACGSGPSALVTGAALSLDEDPRGQHSDLSLARPAHSSIRCAVVHHDSFYCFARAAETSRTCAPVTLPSDVGGPTTQEVGFFACDASSLAEWMREGLGRSWRVRRPRWTGGDDAVNNLAPGGPRTRCACVPIGGWTLVLTNGPLGTDVGVLPSHAARDLGVRAVRAVLVEDGRTYPARILEVYGPDGEPPLAVERSVTAANDGGRWVFETTGRPYEFEDLEAYSRSRKAARFTGPMLHAYLRSLGVPIDVEPSWRDSRLVATWR